MRQQVLGLSTLLLCVSLNAYANQHSTDLLNIEVSEYSYSSTLNWYLSSYEILSNGVKFSTNEWIGGGNSGFPESGELTFVVNDLKLFAKSGYKITGYEFTFSGNVMASEQASATISGGMMGGGYQN